MNKSKYLPDPNATVNYNVEHEENHDHVISDEEYLERQDICGKCEYLTEREVCRKCGCVQKNKSRIRSVHCPIEKW